MPRSRLKAMIEEDVKILPLKPGQETTQRKLEPVGKRGLTPLGGVRGQISL